MKFKKVTKMLVIVTIITLLITSAAARRGGGGGGSRGGSSAGGGTPARGGSGGGILSRGRGTTIPVGAGGTRTAGHSGSASLARDAASISLHTLCSSFLFLINTIEYKLMMQEDPQLVPSANSKSPLDEENTYMLGGQDEKDESPNLQSPNFPF
ncbi:glycine-rich cell wall structural protein [Salix suchowensis]|nr:glycine-rich cell wall structural protein [Salix suchowensis]